MNTEAIKTALFAIGVRPYKTRYSANPLHEAKDVLQGRTYYVDNAKFHKSRILSTYNHEHGLLYGIIESLPDSHMNASKRIRRFVVFDLWGTIVAEGNVDTTKQAEKAIREAIASFDIEEHTVSEIRRRAMREMAQYQEALEALAEVYGDDED